MTLDPRQLRADSRALLCPQLQNARKLALISQGALLGVNLLLCVLEVLLETVINESGGLSGMGLRSALSTVTTMYSLAISFLSPFWSISILFVFLGIIYWNDREKWNDRVLKIYNKFICTYCSIKICL